MKDIRALLDEAVENRNAAAAFMITGNTDAIPCYYAVQAQATLAIALLLEKRELREQRELGHTLHHISRKADATMALAQEILDAIAGLTSSVTALQGTVDQIIAAVDAQVAAGTLTPEQGQTILGAAIADKAAVDNSRTLLDAEIAKLTPPPPGTTPNTPA